ncbi:MAG TPA: phosphotransferase [Candidatus Binatia bacterium]|nr:phosphotransferase [Candidatus Binatia bacterium]
MLEDPGLDTRALADSLRAAYGIGASRFTFVPGHDPQAAAYDVAGPDGRWFAKVRFGPRSDVPLEVPRALLDAGVTNVLAPMRTHAGTLAHPLPDDRSLVVQPFVAGRDAMVAGMSAAQWRGFGSALRAVHDSGLEERFADRLPVESFALPSAAVLRTVLDWAPSVRSSQAVRLRAFLDDARDWIDAAIGRAEELGAVLRGRPHPRVLCHADIHAANVLVADDGRILMVGWDGPMLAPRERDLLFVIGSRIARAVQPHEEAWFFEGYGAVEVDPEAIVYYRYERIIEDIGVDAAIVLADPAVPRRAVQSRST